MLYYASSKDQNLEGKPPAALKSSVGEMANRDVASGASMSTSTIPSDCERSQEATGSGIGQHQHTTSAHDNGARLVTAFALGPIAAQAVTPALIDSSMSTPGHNLISHQNQSPPANLNDPQSIAQTEQQSTSSQYLCGNSLPSSMIMPTSVISNSVTTNDFYASTLKNQKHTKVVSEGRQTAAKPIPSPDKEMHIILWTPPQERTTRHSKRKQVMTERRRHNRNLAVERA